MKRLYQALRSKKFLSIFITAVLEETKKKSSRCVYIEETLNTLVTPDDVKLFTIYHTHDLPALIDHGCPNLLSDSSSDFSAAFHCSMSPINFSGRVDKHKLKVNPNVEKM